MTNGAALLVVMAKLISMIPDLLIRILIILLLIRILEIL
jgi:hypothetical protein